MMWFFTAIAVAIHHEWVVAVFLAQPSERSKCQRMASFYGACGA